MDLLRTYFQIKEDEKEFVAKKKIIEKILQLDEKLRSNLPAFHDLLSFEPEDEKYRVLEPQQKRNKMLEAIRDLMICESQNKIIIIAALEH